jgi:hypothetical protein
MSVEEFNKKLKEKLEDKFGKEYVDNKIVIMGLDDDDEEDYRETDGTTSEEV